MGAFSCTETNACSPSEEIPPGGVFWARNKVMGELRQQKSRRRAYFFTLKCQYRLNAYSIILLSKGKEVRNMSSDDKPNKKPLKSDSSNGWAT